LPGRGGLGKPEFRIALATAEKPVKQMKKYFILIAFFIFACSNENLPKGSFEKKFDETLWKSTEAFEIDKDNISLRQKMLGDLVKNHLLGKKRELVITMLGEPSTKMDPDGNGPSLSYPTGYERGSYMGIDSEWLIIKFDSVGMADSYYIGTD
jgi:hypothetical protein